MTEPDSTELVAVHRLRALTVELDLLGADFAQKHSLHPTDIRALICLLDADRAGTRATPGWLGGQLGLESASVTALIDRMSPHMQPNSVPHSSAPSSTAPSTNSRVSHPSSAPRSTNS